MISTFSISRGEKTTLEKKLTFDKTYKMEKDEKYYNDLVASLQKQVQINPMDTAAWELMIATAEEAIARGVDVERWKKALKIMQQQAKLLHNI